ncbi:MAG: hypothetical protein Q9160_009071 [Pyrenula sp. 1 TL-2023]
MTATTGSIPTSSAAASPPVTAANPLTNEAEFYSSLSSVYEAAFGHDAGLLRFLQIVLKHLPESGGASILDIGCGTGHPVATTFAAAGHRIHGLDISDEMVQLSQKAVSSGGTFEVADMRTWQPSPASESFDAILAILSLFTLTRPEIEAQVQRSSSWLQQGGLLCVGSIAAEYCHPESKGVSYDGDGRCARDIPFRFMGNDVPVTLLTREGWTQTLRENGFEVVETMTELFQPPAEAQSDEEMHFFLVARKVK